ncbi:hypothetical protein AMAG_09237 [Allomyces macrogynus ATCC 38327]|uniref:Uncharacterized protein n=1 Tax=Allomyces macrogynus (strain ATCC 38327) TaxID=578462 RepID=A0A0L0SNW9_ALLM3|nr:hypothetical protein AMAG_09237 [Allomyces macrogynus ATCC 38327]|eukprot:KNE64192.1 hypothetical protein AMAG_09237 [Allomyces macrogynus ATCC 38327]
MATVDLHSCAASDALAHCAGGIIGAQDAITVQSLDIDQLDQIVIVNGTGAPLDVRKSKDSGGSDDWYTLAANASDKWARRLGEWESVIVKQNGQQAGACVPVGSQVTIHADDRHRTRCEALRVCDQGYKRLGYDTSKTMTIDTGVIRNGWEKVKAQFKTPAGDVVRRGVFAALGDEILFRGLDPIEYAKNNLDPAAITVVNATDGPVDVYVTASARNTGDWCTLASSKSDTWVRNAGGFEAVLVRNQQGTVVAAYVPDGSNVIVRHFDRQNQLDHGMLRTTTPRPGRREVSSTTSLEDVNLFVTKLSGDQGNDSWRTVKLGELAAWEHRQGLEFVVVASTKDSSIQQWLRMGPSTKVSVTAAPGQMG